MRYRELVDQKVYGYLVVRISKDLEEYEVVFSSTKYPYWRKSLITADELSAKEKFVDVHKAIRDKSPKLYSIIPNALINWFKERIVHDTYINNYLYEAHDIRDFEFCEKFLDYSAISVKTVGAENIPTKGGAIFAANHPLGGTDALAILVSIGRYRSDVKFLANDLLEQIMNLRGLFVGINAFGTNARENIRKVDELFASDNAIFILSLIHI